MRIFEVTQINEAAPGSVGAQAGSFLSGVGQALAQKMIPAGGNTAAALDKSVAPGQAQGKAAEISGPAVAALAKTLQTQWSNTLTSMMQQARNPQTGKPGVQSIADIEPVEMQKALISMVNGNLQRMSGRQVSDYKDAPKLVDKTANQGKLPTMVTDMVASIDRAIDALLITDPKRENAAKLAGFWNTIAQNSYGIANEVEFNPVGATTTRASANTPDNQLAQQAAKAGLTTKQLGISTKIAPTRDPALNKLLASVGALQTTPQTAAVAAESKQK
jgi:Tfp pilus assembly protein PilX